MYGTDPNLGPILPHQIRLASAMLYSDYPSHLQFLLYVNLTPSSSLRPFPLQSLQQSTYIHHCDHIYLLCTSCQAHQSRRNAQKHPKHENLKSPTSCRLVENIMCNCATLHFGSLIWQAELLCTSKVDPGRVRLYIEKFVKKVGGIEGIEEGQKWYVFPLSGQARRLVIAEKPPKPCRRQSMRICTRSTSPSQNKQSDNHASIFITLTAKL